MPGPSSVAALQVNTGGTSTAAPPPDCASMEVQNQQLRQDLASDAKSAAIRKIFGAGGASTVAHGALLPGGPVMGSTSRLLPSRYNNRVVKGLWDRSDRPKMRQSGSSNLCPDPPFQYGNALRPHQSHCESKLLETLFNPARFPQPPSGTLLLNINWQQAAGSKKVPCRACEKLLCHAQQKCNLNIKLCQEDPEDPPEDLSCPPESS
jgi:hypothetical protein